MHADKHAVRRARWMRGLAVAAALSILPGCAMHAGERHMGGTDMDEMHQPMHQMMQELGCAHDPADMQAMQKMTPDEKRAHMTAHVAACKAKLRQQAADEAMARIDRCIDERMSTRHTKRLTSKRMKAAMMADLRACASAQQPGEPNAHEGH